MTGTARTEPISPAGTLVLRILLTISFCHFLNDMMQSLIPAIYPILKASYHLSFSQVGLITLTNQLTASVLQPVVGVYTDRHPQPFSLPVGMGFTLTGLILLSRAGSFPALLVAVALVGVGSSILHPESSRVARMASGGQHGLAQSVFQVGGNAGGALGPLLAAFFILPRGQGSIAWFGLGPSPPSSCSPRWAPGTGAPAPPSSRRPGPPPPAPPCPGARWCSPFPSSCA